MGVEAHVDALGRMPELGEDGIEVEVDPHRDLVDHVRVREHSGHIQQHVRLTGGRSNLLE
jgi:hypothetical protein